MATNLTGSPQLAYQGVEAGSPPNFRRINRPPVSGVQGKDILNWNLGDIWLDYSLNLLNPPQTPIPYILVSKGDSTAPNTPTWSAFASTGSGATTFHTDAGDATVVASAITIHGGEVLNTSGAGSTVTVNLDRSTNGKIIIAATGAASAYGSLTSTGGTITVTGGANTLNVDTAGSVAIEFDGDSGTSTPALGIEKIIGASGRNITTAASSNQVTVAVSGTTNHAVQLGDATGSLDSLTLGSALQVLQSGGAAADPAWSTATYPATTTQGDVLYSSSNNVVAGLAKNTTATRYLSNTGASNNPAWAQVNLANGVTGVLPIANGGTNASSMATTNGVNYFDGTRIVTTAIGTATHVLTSNGVGFAPTFQVAPGSTGFTSVVRQVFTGSGTYTPTAAMVYCIVEAVGGGAGGGGEDATSSTQVASAGGGGAGGYCSKVFSAATIGVSQVVTIGAGGAGGAAGHNNGTDGGDTTFGALLTADGGDHGDSATQGPACAQSGGPGGSASGGDINISGESGFSSSGITNATSSFALGGNGGSSMYGAGGMGPGNLSGGAAGSNATGYGAGGGGAALGVNSIAYAGGNGTSGIVIVTEFVN